MDRNDFTSEEAYQWYLKFTEMERAQNFYSSPSVPPVEVLMPTRITMMATHIATLAAFVLLGIFLGTMFALFL